MTLSVTHPFVSAKADGTDNTKVQPSNWNAAHTLTAAINNVLGTDGASTIVKELSCTAAGRALLAAADVPTQKSTLNIAEIPIGGSFMWFGTSLPPTNGSVVWGWANGQAISRATYATLFGQWSTTFGAGDGSTTFNVPDMRDVVAVGTGTMGGTSARGLITNQSGLNNQLNANASLWGEAAHVLSVAEMPVHNHPNSASTSITDPGHVHANSWTSSTQSTNQGTGGVQTFMTGVSIFAGSGGVTGSWNTASNVTGITASTTVNVLNTGNGNAHNNIQPSISVGWVVRLA